MTEPRDDDCRLERAIWDMVQEWLELGADDLRLARLMLRAEPPYRGVVFRSQQAAEKYLKALLTRAQVEFDRSHDIDYLLERLDRTNPDLVGELASARQLSAYAVAPRYPYFPRHDDRDEAAALLELANHVAESVLAVLKAYLDRGRPE